MNGFVRLAVTGELDIATAPSVEDALAGLQDHGTVIVDLGELTFIDVTGVRTFAAADRRARSDGSLLVILNCRPSVRWLFEVTGTGDLLDAWPVSELFDADDNAWIPMQLPVSRREIVSADP